MVFGRLPAYGGVLIEEGILDEPIVAATWGLVVVTALLVVATLIPFVGDLLKRRSERAVIAARAVPDMNILRSRLEGDVKRLGKTDRLTKEKLERQVDSCNDELRMLVPIVEVRDASLAFTNEVFLVRHLLTFTESSLTKAVALAEEVDPQNVRNRDQYILDARRGCQAALLSLDAAEALLPRRQRLIKGERFWDRFARVSDERENEAAGILLQDQKITRTGRGAPS